MCVFSSFLGTYLKDHSKWTDTFSLSMFFWKKNLPHLIHGVVLRGEWESEQNTSFVWYYTLIIFNNNNVRSGRYRSCRLSVNHPYLEDTQFTISHCVGVFNFYPLTMLKIRNEKQIIIANTTLSNDWWGGFLLYAFLHVLWVSY